MVYYGICELIVSDSSSPCVVLQNDRDVHIFSVSRYERFLGFFLQVRNLTLAFQAAESIGIKPSLVS